MLTCRELIDFLWKYLSHELSPAERFGFDAHLAVCPSCVAYLASYAETVRMGRVAFAEPELDRAAPAEVPEELVRAVLAAREREGA